jgi:hypothetical protein
MTATTPPIRQGSSALRNPFPPFRQNKHRDESPLQRPLPPISRETRRNVVFPLGVKLPERQTGPGRIIDRRLEKTKGRTQRTRNKSRGKSDTTQNSGDSKLYPEPLFSTSLARSSVLEKFSETESHKQDFANGQRILKIIKTEQLSILTTNDNERNNVSPKSSSAVSMCVTPTELYNNFRPKLSIKTNTLSHEPEYRLTPIETDLGVLAVIASIPDPNSSSSFKREFLRRASTIKSFHRCSKGELTEQGTSMTAFEISNGALVAVIRPERNVWQRSIYLPGKISFKTSSPGGSSSILTPLDILQDGTQVPEVQLRDKADDGIVDDIVEYFESFGPGFDFESLQTGLDMFWTESPVVTRRSGPPEISTCNYYSTLRAASWYDNLPGEAFSFAIRSFDYPSRNSGDWQNKIMSLMSSSQKSDSLKSKVYSPEPTSSALPHLPLTPPASSPRKSKPGNRATPSSLPKISFRRFLQSAGNII